MPGASAPIRYSMRTHVGKVRKANEDAVIDLPVHQIWAVSDGMGGHRNGAFASHAVTEALSRLSPDLSSSRLMQAAREAIQDAHGAILAESERNGGATIGATVVVLMISGGHFACLWAGDSRLYMLSEDGLIRVSRDHSLVADLVEAGKLTDAEAEQHPQANIITRAVGVGERLEIDKRIGRTLPGDRFLLCSDGLTKYADDELIARVLASEPIDTVSDRLLEIALEAGGADNISVIVVEVPENGAPSIDKEEETTVVPKSGSGSRPAER